MGGDDGLERRLVVVRAGGAPPVARGGRRLRPRVALRAATAARGLRAGTAAADRPAGAATATAATRAAGDLRGRVAQRRADLIDLELDGGALLAVAVVVRPLLQPAGRDDARSLRERARDVLGELAPDTGPEEQRFAVLPVVALPIEGPRRRCDGEVGDRQTVLRVPQLRVG